MACRCRLVTEVHTSMVDNERWWRKGAFLMHFSPWNPLECRLLVEAMEGRSEKPLSCCCRRCLCRHGMPLSISDRGAHLHGWQSASSHLHVGDAPGGGISYWKSFKSQQRQWKEKPIVFTVAIAMVKGGEHRKSREERNSIIVGDANFYRGAIAAKNLAFPSPLTAAVAQPKHGRFGPLKNTPTAESCQNHHHQSWWLLWSF